MDKSAREFAAGRSNIEQRLVSESRDNGLPLAADNIFWNRNRNESGVPEASTVEIKFQGRTANAILSREQIEDSCERIDRSDVLAAIKQCVADLARSPR